MNKKLMNIQSELKAPKGQYNRFGEYTYRSCEDILEAVKPVLAKHGCTLTISDSIMLIGDRFYVKATATLSDTDSDKSISVSAYAREAQDKKKLDVSQVTGATSSYARKYALNGLFCIDDTKDADTDEHRQQQEKGGRKAEPKQQQPKQQKPAALTKDELIDKVVALCDAKRIKVSDICMMSKVNSLEDLTVDRLEKAIEWIGAQ